MVDIIYSMLRGIASIFGLEVGFVGMWEAIRTFLEMGGQVLFLIGILMVVMWVLMIERFLYFATRHQSLASAAIDRWNARMERKSWYAHRIREALISEIRLSATQYIGIIQACVALCPLMGLLGTVTGMIEVFEVMAIMGSGNPRAMAAGVSKATIPTMCGMVAALSGLFLSVWLKRKSEREVEILGEHMTMDH